jgi:membrane protein DedA with SNARE-associated domain
MFHKLFATWLALTLKWGYGGIFVLMAIESTVFPLPSEVVIPPAAYWARQGHLNFWAVVLTGTFGSWAGAAISYLVARRLGRPLILKYGKYFFVPEKKWLLAEEWINRYSVAGIFFARLLPVVRHLVSLPAGAARMPFARFSLTTLLGSFLWCTVLAWFGAQVLGDEPRLLQDPEALSRVLRDKLLWFVAAAAVLFVLYLGVDLIGRRLRRQAAGAEIS